MAVAAQQQVPFDSIVALTAKPLAIPSRAGLDPVEPMLDATETWLCRSPRAVFRIVSDRF